MGKTLKVELTLEEYDFIMESLLFFRHGIEYIVFPFEGNDLFFQKGRMRVSALLKEQIKSCELHKKLYTIKKSKLNPQPCK